MTDKLKLFTLKFEVVPDRIMHDGNRWKFVNQLDFMQTIKKLLPKYPEKLGEKKEITIYID